MTAELEGDEWSAALPGRTLPPWKTRYPLYTRLGGPHGRSGRSENLVPTGIRSRTDQPVVSRYTVWATQPTIIGLLLPKSTFQIKNEMQSNNPRQTYWLWCPEEFAFPVYKKRSLIPSKIMQVIVVHVVIIRRDLRLSWQRVTGSRCSEMLRLAVGRKGTGWQKRLCCFYHPCAEEGSLFYPEDTRQAADLSEILLHIFMFMVPCVADLY